MYTLFATFLLITGKNAFYVKSTQKQKSKYVFFHQSKYTTITLTLPHRPRSRHSLQRLPSEEAVAWATECLMSEVLPAVSRCPKPAGA